MSGAEFNEAILTNAEFLKPFAFTLTHDSEKAKDLYQETVLLALVNREKFCVGSNMRAWLYIIMRNAFINGYRHKTTQKRTVDGKKLPYSVGLNAALAQNDGLPNMSEKEVRGAIYRLPDMFKKPFLFYFQGYRYNEIAQMLKEPLGTVKSHIHFARKLLKARIERQ